MLYWIPLQCKIDSMAITRTSRVYTISLPPELARKAEALAKRDSRTMSELFREAFRTYYAQQSRKILEEIGEYANRRNPGYTETDVPRLIKEVRSATPVRRHIRTRRDRCPRYERLDFGSSVRETSRNADASARKSYERGCNRQLP